MDNYDAALQTELNKSYEKLLTLGYSKTHLSEAKTITQDEMHLGIHSLARLGDALLDNYEWIRGFTYDQ